MELLSFLILGIFVGILGSLLGIGGGVVLRVIETVRIHEVRIL